MAQIPAKDAIIAEQIRRLRLAQQFNAPKGKIPLQIVWVDSEGSLVECEIVYAVNLTVAMRTMGQRIMDGRDPNKARGFYVRATIDQSLTTLPGTAAQRAKRGI